MSTQVAPLVMTNPHFRKGFELGRFWYKSGEPILPLTDEYVLQNVTMWCEKEWHTDPNWLAERAGFLVGMLSGSFE